MDNKEEMKAAPQALNEIDWKDEIVFDELLSKVGPITPPDTTLKSSDSVHDKFHRTLILSGFCLLK
ncbi:hypothetical protein, partial [Acinetobacter baumannii]|uniref:hypothetical protein n=1 Tax=Acinetobacter baumannii TaxID=470 RepID=UPI004027715E